MADNRDARALACQSWFGYGRWDAPYWFVGMEPGGEDDLAWYETWLRLGGHELCDCREHHVGTNYTKWHGRDRPPLQRTWLRLIQLLFGYKGQRAENLDVVSVYQRDEWGSLNGETALPEVSAIRAKSRATVVNRNAFRGHRVATLRERLEHYQPEFVVFYGFEYTSIYQEIANAGFDADGYAWCGSTLCALVRHPTGPNNPSEIRSGKWWIGKGHEMRRRIVRDEEGFRARAPEPANSPQHLVPVRKSSSVETKRCASKVAVGQSQRIISQVSLEDSGYIARYTTAESKHELTEILRDWLKCSDRPTIGDKGNFGGKLWIVINLDGNQAAGLNADTTREAVAEYLEQAGALGADVPWHILLNQKGRWNKLGFKADREATPGWYCYLRQNAAGPGQI